jgi:hypothetical protein
MHRIAIAVALAMLIAGAVWAVEADDAAIQGNYRGTYSTSTSQEKEITAKIIAEGQDQFRVLADIGQDAPVVLTGKGAGASAAFVGVSETFGQATSVLAGIVDGRLMGFVMKPVSARFELEKVYEKSPTLGMAPPEGAVVLFDGANLDAWELIPGNMAGGAMVISASSFVSKEEFGDAQIHLEFCTPLMPDARGQARGNSGVYVHGRYEIQVLDSFGDEPADNLCGGIYQQATPRLNACLPPGEWQTYDIVFRAPRFDGAGEKTENAVITVEHNGVLIHDQVSLSGPTPGGVRPGEGPTGPLYLQNHNDRVQYKNIWVKPIE